MFDIAVTQTLENKTLTQVLAMSLGGSIGDIAMKEIWKFIDGFDRYQVSNFGKVRNNLTGRILKQRICKKNGYLMLALCKDGVRKVRTIHSLIANAFIIKDFNGSEVNHKDGNKLNNAPSNLEWVTRSQNNKHAIDSGLRIPARGERQHSAKLREQDVLQIRKVYKEVGSLILSSRYRVTRETITSIIRRQTWKHI
jgi:hypothetical protein